MKRFSVEIKVAVLIVIAVGVVAAAGYISYRSLSYILSTIKKEAQPNLTLLILKEVNNDLNQCESSIKYFTSTRNEKYLYSYYNTTNSVDQKIDRLYRLNSDNLLKKNQIDTINQLIYDKFSIWQRLLKLREDDSMLDALNKLSIKLDTVQDSLTMQVPTNVTIIKKDSIIRQSKFKDESKSSFLSRLFNRKIDESGRGLEPPVIQQIVEETIESRDTSFEVGINRELIQEEIDKILVEEDEEQRLIAARELILVKRNEQLTQKLNKLISQMEYEELYSISEKAKEADSMVDSTNWWLIFFVITLSVLLLSVFYVIQRYIRKSNAHQAALLKAKNEAEKLNKTKEQFIANMSHEIRTPMNAIVGFTDQLLQLPGDNRTIEQLDIIKSSANHLLRIINDILDFSKLEVGKLMLEDTAFNIRSVLSEAYLLYRPAAYAKSIDYQFVIEDDVPEIVIGDPFRLRQILFNLISNAVKFTSEGKIIIKVSAKPRFQNRTELFISISDSGIGIPSDKLESVFEEFNQAEINTTRKFGGTGLGLSIVKKLIDLHKGRIRIESKLGKGTEIYLALRYSVGKEISSTKELPVVQPYPKVLSNKVFLVADDDEYNRKLISHILKKWNVKFKLLQDGVELVNEYRSNSGYDLALIDIRMPNIDGIQATRKIREIEKSSHKQMPIIALTATVVDDELKKCEQVGIEKVVAKPFTEQELFESIVNVLNIDVSKFLEKEGVSQVKQKIETPPLEEIKHFQNLYYLANNDLVFVKEMLEMFVKTSCDGLKEIKDGLEHKDFIKIAEYAHKIKSPCKHLDAEELSILLKELEIKARNGAVEKDVEAIILKMEQKLYEVVYEVNKHLEQILTIQN